MFISYGFGAAAGIGNIYGLAGGCGVDDVVSHEGIR